MYRLCYSMVCPPIRGENPRALASGLSSVQAEKYGILYTFIRVNLAHCAERNN